MHPGLYAFGFAAAFLGAAVYVCVVEQPARLALPPDAMMKAFSRSGDPARANSATPS